MKPYFFTFGVGHLDKHGNSLFKYYTIIHAYTMHQARNIMFAYRGDKFCACYDTAEEAAGVDRHEMHIAILDNVMLPPST